ncbi:hypothetical protein [Kineosporia sp. A_224]|uniref:hypothetical protein n=1 Tax=Kineosporia sp. A_224 TaxID=1962180 RepID=UPI001179F461|nr:hypothetical protein [Kineosporia sp. A_224]
MRTTYRTARLTAVALLALGAGLALAACVSAGTTGTVAGAPSSPAATAVAPDDAPPTVQQVGSRPSSASPTTRSSGGASTGATAVKKQPGTVAPRETIYAELVDAWRATPAGFGVSYDRVTRLTGQEAIDYQKKHWPDEEPYSDYYLNENPKLRNVVVSPDAVINGNQQLGPGNGTQSDRLTPDELVDQVQQNPRTLVRLVTEVIDDRTQVVRIDEIYMP